MKECLFNKYSKEDCLKLLAKEGFSRTTLSFYRYVQIEDPKGFRNELYREWSALGVLGRIYVAHEGINAQLNVPTHNLELFKSNLESHKELQNMPLKIAVDEAAELSFYKLTIKVKKYIVADGLGPDEYDVTNVGTHLTAKEFNEALEEPGTLVVDMRNQYESEVGRFENALCPDADTFREELRVVHDALKGNEDKKILLYCTGGVRCEKASAYFKHYGFRDVNQLYGGIIQYAHEVRAQKLPSKFKGKNFVFDERMGERITDDIISECHQCGVPCDTHTNCANDACHLLFIQCEECRKKYNNCCTPECAHISQLPLEEQRERRAGMISDNPLSVYKSRLRPKLKERIQLSQKSV